MSTSMEAVYSFSYLNFRDLGASVSMDISERLSKTLHDLNHDAHAMYSLDSIPSFEECQKITLRLKETVLSWFESVKDEPGKLITDKILEIVATVARLSKRRIFQNQGKDDEFCLNLVELDKIKSEISDMLVLGKHLPKLDSALLMPFSELISTVIKSYVNSIDRRRQEIASRTDLSVDELADEKRELTSSLSIAAFRLRHLANSFMGLVSLQTPFILNNQSGVKDIIALLKEKELVLCQCESNPEIFVFVSPSLLQDHVRAERFCYSNVNTSPDLAQDLIVVVPNSGGSTIESDVKLAADSILSRYASSGNRGGITIAAKSIVALRLMTADLQKIGSISLGSSLMPLRVSEQTSLCFEGVEKITSNLSDLCMQISMSLALLQEVDSKSYARRGLDIETDYMIMTAVSYAFQFMLDAPFVTKSLQNTFEIHVSRSLHWLGVCSRNYTAGRDCKFSALSMTVILEYLNSLFFQGLYSLPESWNEMITELEKDFKQLAAAAANPEVDQAQRAFILDQAQTMFRRLGRDCRRSRETSLEEKYPDQKYIQAHNLYILSHSSYSKCDIYKCLDLITRKLVVIKKIPKKFLSRKAGKLSELDFLKALRNINIVIYLGSFESEDHLFLQMEYCDSQILPNGLNKKTEMEARMIGRQIVLGLCYLHANHIIHRDIKPGNILMNGAGFVKIADFGEAQLNDNLRKDRKFNITELYGTPLYMAPECLHSWKVGTSADIWSFGCVLARLVSGIEPWAQCEGKSQVLFQLGSSKNSPFEIDQFECSVECKKVIKSCLQRKPESRPTAVELLNIPYFSDLPDSFV